MVWRSAQGSLGCTEALYGYSDPRPAVNGALRSISDASISDLRMHSCLSSSEGTERVEGGGIVTAMKISTDPHGEKSSTALFAFSESRPLFTSKPLHSFTFHFFHSFCRAKSRQIASSISTFSPSHGPSSNFFPGAGGSRSHSSIHQRLVGA
jgi:hypothetical protein